ncbi:protein artichoke-like isoform X2 [Stegodyphus dumicola]|nr:protein artichoke-like isoform X2 [Stegodyphus dumicola]
MKLILLLCNIFIVCATVVSQCPPRKEIHPCICIEKQLGKRKYELIILCYNIGTPASFSNIETRLRHVEIEKFLLYDSYWRGSPGQQSVLPKDFLNSYKIKEVEIVDTSLNTGFACRSTPNCEENNIIKLTISNSSLGERSFQACLDDSRVTSFLDCLVLLKHLKITRANLPIIRHNFFSKMPDLRELILQFNQITRIERQVFTAATFPSLEVLDLSHNGLLDVKNLFTHSEMKIAFLDLSYNQIKSLFNFKKLPKLKKLLLRNNDLIELSAADWQSAPKILRYIDFRENDLNCDCNFKWVNDTFHMNTEIIGNCAAPKEVASMKLRKASRLLKLRCDEEGKIARTN